MAKLSEQKKVELLENAVLYDTVESIENIWNEHAPFEFTARALGYAARFRGADMVQCLIDHGATFAYEASAAFTKKYATKRIISNNYSCNADYSLYILKDEKIFPEPDNMTILSDEERAKVLCTLHAAADKIDFNEQEIFFLSILYGDSAVQNACTEAGICTLTEKRAANLRCDINYAHMDGMDRYFRDQFTWTLRRADPEDFKRILTDILPLLGEKPMQMMPADLFFSFTDKKNFYETYCAEGLFDLVVKHTNLLDKVKKADLVQAFVSQGNLTGLTAALNEKWISKAKDLEALLELAQKQNTPNAAVIACIMEYTEKNVSKKAKTASSGLGANPMSVSELKKVWSYKKTEDGTLMLTSYKGKEAQITVPAVIGKDRVTVIGESCFSPKAQRVTAEMYDVRTHIESVTLPEGLTHIEANAFYDCTGLTRVVCPESLKKIDVQAFTYCKNLKDIHIPENTEVERGAFSGCTAMADENGFIILRGVLYSYTGKAENLTLPAGITRVCTGAISGKDALKTLVFSKDTVEIEDRAVNFCNNLRGIAIYPATTKIARHAFGSCHVAIYAPAGSYAETYAKEHNIPFVAK